MKNNCIGCTYYRKIKSAVGSSVYACHYALDNKQCRPCSSENCTVKSQKTYKPRVFYIKPRFKNK